MFACPLFQVSYVFINGNTYSQADSDQTSIKRHVPVMWPWDTTSSEKKWKRNYTLD